MSLSSIIADRQPAPKLMLVPVDEVNNTNEAYEALLNDRTQLLEQIWALKDDNRILAERAKMLDEAYEEVKAELFERNDALVAIRTTLESQSIDF